MREIRSILTEIALLAGLAAATASLSPFGPAELGPGDPAAVASETMLVDWFRAHSPSLTEAEQRVAAETVAREARRHGFEVDLILAVIEVESGGDAFACSHVGAVGLMQLRSETAEETAHKLGLDWRGVVSLTEPAVNIRLGAAYLRTLVDRFGGIEPALAAYNMGPSRIASRLSRGDPLPLAYARRVERAFGSPLWRGLRLL